jgi:hypothetical protein
LLHAPPLFQHCCCDSRSVPPQIPGVLGDYFVNLDYLI